MKNVLIISYYFPPINKIASRRYGQMVEFMEENGWKPWVLTTKSQGDLPLTIESEQIIRISGNVQSFKKKRPSKLSMIMPIVTKMGLKPLTVDRTLKWVSQVKENEELIKNKLPKIDLVLSSFGPSCAFELGLYFKKLFKVPAILEFRDMAAFLDKHKIYPTRVFDKYVEKRYVKDYDHLLTVSPALKTILEKNYNKDVDVIYNGWLIANGPKKKSSDERYIYYAGRIYDHQIDSLGILLKAMKSVDPSIKLKVRSISVEWIEKEFLKMVETEGLDDRVDLLEPCTSETANREASQAMINLIIEDLDKSNYWSKGTLTGKLMQLMPLDPPLLSIARDDNDMGSILLETERGKLCSSVNEVKAFIQDLFLGKENYKIDVTKMEKFSKRFQTKKLCAIFNKLSGEG